MIEEPKWRTVAELRLTEALVPNPNSTSELLQQLHGVRVAISDGLLHIDPRPAAEVEKEGVEYTVTAVPTSSVEYIRYQAVSPSAPGAPRVRWL